MNEIIKFQPNINIGMIGHVSNGKSSIVDKITHTKTQRFANEKKTNKTIKLGYANAKIFKCDKCKSPKCYQSYKSSIMKCKCVYCYSKMKLVRHVSLEDSPGHNSLTKVMLNGTCVMDTTIIVEAANNKIIPSPQTREHMKAAYITGLGNQIVCMNKMDLVKKKIGEKKISELQTYMKNTIAKNSDIIPVVANFGINIDIVLEYICTKIPEPVRDFESLAKMIIIRSFNINNENIKISELVGGVIGGSILKGILKVGDKIEIMPGVFTKNKGKKNNKDNYIPKWKCTAISSTVLSIYSEKNKLSMAIPGGLVGVQLSIDPALTAKDGLIGNILRVKDNINSNNYKIFESLFIDFSLIDDEKMYYMKKDNIIEINHNACNITCKILKIKIKKKLAVLELLDKPICAEIGNTITLSVKRGKTFCIIGNANIKDGDYSICI